LLYFSKLLIWYYRYWLDGLSPDFLKLSSEYFWEDITISYTPLQKLTYSTLFNLQSIERPFAEGKKPTKTRQELQQSDLGKQRQKQAAVWNAKVVTQAPSAFCKQVAISYQLSTVHQVLRIRHQHASGGRILQTTTIVLTIRLTLKRTIIL
jgi:hypothetical protein